MDEGIVECCEDVAHTEIVLGLFAGTHNGGSVIDNLLFLNLSLLFTFSTFSALLAFLSL
jgi:hypothetical protein